LTSLATTSLCTRVPIINDVGFGDLYIFKDEDPNCMNPVLVSRCSWADNSNDPEMLLYHDTEWGVPVHNDIKLFEFIVLECAQAGLSWSTILRKRLDYRKAFVNYDVKKVAEFSLSHMEKLLQSTNIVRNRLKVNSAVTNARAFIKIQDDFGSFDNYIWDFVEGRRTKHNFFKDSRQIPTTSTESSYLSKDLKERGFSFVGPTICYALMQAIGMINDHTTNCFRHKELIEMKF
jgi:DNA-3-methyladenine glycosylase I